MKDLKYEDPFKEFLELGVANDIFQSQIHFFGYRTIAENANEVNKKEESNLRKQLAYLQGVSMDAALLSSAKIFDSQNIKYRVNCLRNLLDECKIFDCNTKFPYRLEYCPELSILSEMA